MSSAQRSILCRLTLFALIAQLVSACAAPATPAPTPVPPSAAPTATSVPVATPLPVSTEQVIDNTPTLVAEPPAPTPVAQTATEVSLQPPAAGVKTFGHIELTVETDGVFANLFDPAQVDLGVSFTSPGGDAFRVPAFWYQDFDPATLRPVGEPGWRVRFTPTQAGSWTAQADLAEPQLTSAEVTFDVEADAGARGFVRVNPANTQYFSFDNGDFYFPIGLNVAWAQSLDQTIPQYERWFGSLGGNGGNIARVWMADWSFGVEWTDTGLGNYAGRERQAWLLDQVFNIAEQDGVYILLCLVNHGAFSESVNPEWSDNPYNVANGGMLATPGEFATNVEAREYFKRRVRYIASRWGYSTHLFAWEWWNEVNWTPLHDGVLGPWIAEMSEYLQQFDPYAHLISTSYSGGSNYSLWDMPALSFMQQHDYSGLEPVNIFQSSYRNFRETFSAKPILMAEHGYSAGGAGEELNREAIHVHNGLWTAPFLGYAGTAMAWWWDEFIDPKGLWPEYKHIADFMQGEDLAPTQVGRADAGKDVYALTLHSPTRALVWVRNKGFDASEATRAYEKALRAKQVTPTWTFEPPTMSGQTLTVSDLQDGDYVAYWFDPQTGAWLDQAGVQVAGGVAAIPVPDFSRDLAVKIVGANQPRTPGSP